MSGRFTVPTRAQTAFYPTYATRWIDVECGKVRRRKASLKRLRDTDQEHVYYIDFSPNLKGKDRFLTGDRGYPFESTEHAETIRIRICGQTEKGLTLAEAVSSYRAPKNKRNRVLSLADSWIEHVIESEGDAYEPYTVRGYKGYRNNHFPWWAHRTIDEVTWQALDEWAKHMRTTLGTKSTTNVLFAFRSFLHWYRKHEKGFVIPEFPKIKKTKRARPVTMHLLDQAAAISAVPERDRGIFLAYAHLTIRQGEGRALLVKDYDFKRRELWVASAAKGDNANAPRGDTKTGEQGWYPVSNELAEWIEHHVPTGARFRGDTPLFPNPRTARMYSRKTIQNMWRTACEVAEVEHVPPYRATKHSTLSELARVLTLQQVQALARHQNIETTRMYFGERADPKREAQDAREKLVAEMHESVSNNTPTTQIGKKE